MLRARDDAEPAGLTRGRARRVGALPAMRADLQAREEAERGIVGVVDAPHLEDVVRAHLDAVALALAARTVDDRTPRARHGATLLARTIRMRGRAPRLRRFDACGHCGSRVVVILWALRAAMAASAAPTFCHVCPAAFEGLPHDACCRRRMSPRAATVDATRSTARRAVTANSIDRPAGAAMGAQRHVGLASAASAAHARDRRPRRRLRLRRPGVRQLRAAHPLIDDPGGDCP